MSAVVAYNPAAALLGHRWNTTIFSSVISSTAYLGPSLPVPLSFNPP